MADEREKLMLEIMHRLSEKFKDRLVLKGGMLLRLLNSGRSTQDIDYVLLSKDSKKVLAPVLKEALESIPDVTVKEVRMNSRGIFIDLIRKAPQPVVVLLEISVCPSLSLPNQSMSTQPLAMAYSMTSRIISVMALPEAFSNKIAATLERDVMRDLYDLTLFEPMGPFDEGVLATRLKELCIGRSKPRSVSFSQAGQMLEEKLFLLSEEKIRTQLNPLLPTEQRPGVSLLIKASVGRIANKLKSSLSKN